MALIACSRMYNVTDVAKAAWADLFGWVGQAAAVPLCVIDHAPPEPLAALWQREEMACAFMCGWPFSNASPQPHIVAAPVPRGAHYNGLPVYRTDLIVRKDRHFGKLEDTFGGRLAWTVENSHSGFNALRYHLLQYRQDFGEKLYEGRIGPVLSPAGALESVVSGKADVAPMDSYALDLFRLHQPEMIADVKVIESTAHAPVPPLVAHHDIDERVVKKLQKAFLSANVAPEMSGALASLNLTGFCRMRPTDYDLADRWATEALNAGYLRPE